MQITENTVVVVSGGASGLGGAVARAFAEAGAKVGIFDLNEEAGQAMATRIGGAFAKVDVSDADSVVSAAATREVMARWGRAPVLAAQEPRDGMDPGAHVIAGDILSPGETDRVIGGIMKFINGL